MPDLPSSLALTNIADGADIVASDHRNNYSAIQSAVNDLIAGLSGGTAGQVLSATDADTVAWADLGLSYRKTTAKTVSATVTETDLLNGEITVGAGVLGTTGVLRLTAWGDWKQNSGGTTNVPRFKVKLGGTTLYDTNVLGASQVGNNAARYGWRISVEIVNRGAANSQWVTVDGRVSFTGTGTVASAYAATGEGNYAITSTVADTVALFAGGAAGTVDTSGACALVLSVILPSSSASVDIVLKGALAEVV